MIFTITGIESKKNQRTIIESKQSVLLKFEDNLHNTFHFPLYLLFLRSFGF